MIGVHHAVVAAVAASGEHFDWGQSRYGLRCCAWMAVGAARCAVDEEAHAGIDAHATLATPPDAVEIVYQMMQLLGQRLLWKMAGCCCCYRCEQPVSNQKLDQTVD